MEWRQMLGGPAVASVYTSWAMPVLSTIPPANPASRLWTQYTTLRFAFATGASCISLIRAAFWLKQTSEPSLSLRRQMPAMRFMLKFRQYPKPPTYPCVSSRHSTRSDGRVRPSFRVRMIGLFSDAEIAFQGKLQGKR